MITKTIAGFIDYVYDEGERINIISNGRRHNLTELFEEFVDHFGSMVQVNYWINDNECSKEQMLEAWLKKISGAIETECDEVFQGSLTFENSSCVGYDKYYKLRIGGHDLISELENENGRFIIIELNFPDK